MTSQPVVTTPNLLKQGRSLTPEDRFCFSCHQGLSCFGHCCADVNILLTPYDVLRLSRRLGMRTGEFLDRYALLPITKDLHLPVVMLKMLDEPERRCPFVQDSACSVYADRPWACRMYPLGMALPPARAGVEPTPIFVLMEDDFCLGREQEAKSWKPEEWRRDQGVIERDEVEQGFREIVSHPWFIGGRQLDPKRMELFYNACYDLDGFRDFVFGSSFLRRFAIEESLIEQLRHDDEALFRFAFRWLRFALFGEPTLTVRGDAPRDREKA
jgi:Fe-S-cluster containining protein